VKERKVIIKKLRAEETRIKKRELNISKRIRLMGQIGRLRAKSH
jgi:hypothetical protein